MNEELKAIVQRMIDAGEPEENIKLVIQSYSKEPGKTTDPASSSMDSGSDDGSLESQGLAKLNLEDYSTKSEDYEDVFVGFLKAIPVLATDSEQRAKAVQFMKNRVDNVPEALKSWIKSSAQVYADTYKRGYLSEDSILSKLIGDEKVKTASEGVDDYIIQKYKEIGELEFKDTGKGMVVGAKEGDAASVVAGVFGAGISMAETVIPAAATGGISLFPMIAAPMYTEYNKSKAKALYGEGKTQLTLEEEQSALEKLVENEQAEIAVPLALGSIATGLEYIGFKGITKYISASPMKGKFLANLLWTGSREGFTEVGQLGVETLNEGLGAQKPIKEASIEAWNTMNSDKGLEMWLNGFLGSTQISVGGRALNRALRSDNASVKELNSKINNLADLNSKKYNTKNNDVKEALEKEIKVAEKDIKDYINKKRKISEILNEDQKESLINIINEKDNITSKIESLKKQLEGGVISNKEFGYAARSLNNQDKRLTEQIEAINETAKQQLLVTGLEATKEEGETVGLKQEVFETKEQYAALFGKKGSKKYNEALKADGHISDDGSTYYVNMDTAREAGAIGVGSHELLHGIIGKSFSKLKPEAQRKLNENFLNLLSKRDKETVLNRLAGAYGVTGDKVFTTEELYTAFSDEIVDGGVKFNEGVFGKVANVFEDILRRLSSAGYFAEESFLYRKEFGSARQAYNFVKDYSLTIKKTGKITERAKEFAKVDPGSEGNLASKSKAAESINEIEQGLKDRLKADKQEYTKDQFLYSEEFDDIYRSIKESNGAINNYILSLGLGDKKTKKVIQYASDRLKGYNPQEKRKTGSKEAVTVGERVMSDIMYAKLDADKALAIENKKEGKTLRIDAAKRTQEGESTFDLEDTGVDARLKALETEDMSPAAQAKKKADKAKGKKAKESEFRNRVNFKTGSQIYNEIMTAAVKSLIRAYGKTLNIKDVAARERAVVKEIQKEHNSLTSPLFKQIKNWLSYGLPQEVIPRGTKDIYFQNLREFREDITKLVSTADLVQVEKMINEVDRIFTIYKGTLTKKGDVEKAVDNLELPPDAIRKYDKDKKVSVYDKTIPSETQVVAFANQPAKIPARDKSGNVMRNPDTGDIMMIRSGLKGTRKDGITKNIVNGLVLDAVMEARQSQEVKNKLKELGVDATSVQELSVATGRPADVKFSKSIVINGKKTFSEENLNNMFNTKIKHTSLMGDNQKQKSIKFIDSTIRNLDPVVYSTVVYQLEVLKEQISKDLTIKEIINSTISETKHLYSDVADYKMQLALHNGVLNEQHLTNYLVKAKRITDVQFSGIAFNSLVENLEQQTTATKINNFLKIHGKQAKTVKVMYDGKRITNNILLFEKVIKPIAEKNNIKGYDFVYINKAKTKTRITYKGEEQTGFQNSTEIKQAFKNEDQKAISEIIKKYLEESDLAIKSVFEVINSKNSKESIKSIIKFMAADTDAVLRKIAKPGMMAFGYGEGTVLDHRVPINKVIKEIYKTIDNPTSANKESLREFLENTYVNNIPKNVDTKLNASVKKGGLGFKTYGDINVYDNPEIVELMKGVEVKDYSNIKESRSTKSEVFDKALQFSRSTSNPTKGITVLDFDDTLATTKSLVKFTRPDGTTGTLNAEQYASTYENLLDQGYTFDFSEFNKVVKGKLAPLFQKALKLQSKFGPKNMFVLTARPPAAQKAIFDFLKANGLNIPIDNITGLGNSTAEAKALWIADKVGEGFNDFYFADDALQNVQAVDDVLSQLGVKRKVQQAKVKFSKSLGKDLSKNKNYTKFRNSLKGSVLYHGGTASLSDNKAVWFIASDIVGAELYADRRDGKVYSINSNNLNDAIIIPDVSDLMGLDKVIKNKYKSIAKEVLDKYGQVDIKKVLEADVASEVVSDFMDYINNNFELLDGVYGPETLYDNDGKISKGVPVIVLGGNVSTKVSKVKFSKSIQTIPAVANMLDQFDVKSKVQQARVKFSKTMNNTFNDILQEVTGIEAQKRFSAIKGRKRGDDKGKFRFFIPPSHEDFVGLLYNFMGEGRKGDAHRDFLEQALVRPLNRAYRELDTAKQAIANDYKKLNEQFPDVNDKLIKSTPDGDFTFQDAIRVYLWNKHGHKIPGLTETDQAKLTKLIESDPQLQAYAETLNVISKQEDYVAPGQAWETANIRIDLVDATGRVGRAQYLSEFIENADVLFSEENLNKIEAAYGKDFREALEDMLHRIKTGVNRPKGQSGKPNRFLNWLNASVAGVMFFNTRSALLQQLSNVNYLNFADNNILAAGKAFANQKQYWADFAFILNSDMLKQRRGGIGTDVNGAELVEAIKKARPDSLFDQVAIITGKLLRLGFLPTQMGDSIAIATGGAAFYRNRINTYLKQGLSQKEAEAKAFTDFQDITQSTQQSARPDMTSQQQASWIGKLVLNFLNTPSQYNRIIKKAGSDLKNRRITKPNTTQTQSDMSNLSRILYYGAAQNLIFYGLQTALFAVMFGTEEDDESEAFLKKKERVINGSIDTILRGSGIYGVALSTLKNMMIKFAEQREKGYNKDESAVIMEALNFSPVLGIRARKIVNAEKTLNYNTKVIDEMTTFDIDNPQWSAVTNYVEGTTTLPVNRLYQKTINVRNALDNQYTAFQRAMFFSGYTTWSLDLGDTEKMKKIKEKVKSKKKSKGRKTFKRKTLTR